MKRFYFTILYTLFLISLISCQTVSKKIEDTTTKEEQELSKWLRKPEEDLKSLRSLLAELLKLCPRLSVPDDLWKLANNQSFYSPKSVLEFRIILEKQSIPTKKKQTHLPIVFCLFFGVFLKCS